MTPDGVCFVHFDFHNGAMSNQQCKLLMAVLKEVKENVFSAGMKLIQFVSSLFFVICWSTPLGRVSRDFVVGWC